MDDLLPFYEQELEVLYKNTKQFAERFPKIAASLVQLGERVEDPHIERLIESFALLSARVRKKLKDGSPELTNSFLQAVYPHYFRPIPSCSIAHFEYVKDDATTGEELRFRQVNRKTTLHTPQTKAGVQCFFKTIYDVYLSPLKISSAGYEATISPPGALIGVLNHHACGAINIEFDLSGFGEQGFDAFDRPYVRIFMDAESSLISQIREAVFNQTLQVVLETGDQWIVCPQNIVKEVGFLPEEGLFEHDSRTFHAFLLLTEFFVFNEKFNFFDISIEALKKVYDFSDQKFCIKFLLPAIRDQFLDERLLEQIESHHFKLHCTPVINLFEKTAKPITVDYTTETQTLLADAKNPWAHEVFDILDVRQVINTPTETQVVSCKPLFALNHGTDSSNGAYWMLLCDESMVGLSPGHEYHIAFLDSNFNPHHEERSVLSIDILSTNRNIPSKMPYGQLSGDLFEKERQSESTGNDLMIRLLRKPTKSVRFYRDEDSLWRLISHLNLSKFSAGQKTVSSIKDTFQLYNLTKSSQVQKMIDGVVNVQLRHAQAMISGKYFPEVVRGVEVVIHIQPENFVGIGFVLFAQVLDYYFSQWVSPNRFSQVVILNAENQTEIFKCPPRNGHTPLV